MTKRAAGKQKTYRVFLSRHYIATEWVDVTADSPRKARNRAEAHARQSRPDARAEATDNGWISDDPVEVPEPGSWSRGVYPMEQVAEGVFHMKEQGSA